MRNEKKPSAKRIEPKLRFKLKLPERLDEWRLREPELERWRRIVLWIVDLLIEIWRRIERARPLVQKVERWIKVIGRALTWLFVKSGLGR